MSYGKSALLERRIRALVRETAKDALLREAVTGNAFGQSASTNSGSGFTYSFQSAASPAGPATPAAAEKVKIKLDRVNTKAYKIESYIYFAPNENLLKWVKEDNYAERGETSSRDEDWNEWAKKFNDASESDANQAKNFFLSIPPPPPAWVAEFRPTAAPAPAPGAPPSPAAPSAPKASSALKEIQKMLAFGTEQQTGMWNKKTADGWSSYIDRISKRLPEGNFPDGIKTSWRTTHDKVRVNKDTPSTPYTKDYRGMLEFMKQVRAELDKSGGSTTSSTSGAEAASSTSGAATTSGKITSQLATSSPIAVGSPVLITSTYTDADGVKRDINDIQAKISLPDGRTKIVNANLTGPLGRIKIPTTDLAAGKYTAKITGKVKTAKGEPRSVESSNPVQFELK